jgi:hypothetical protein
MRKTKPRIDIHTALADYDAMYKSLISACFVEFVDFAVPEFAGRIDPDSVVFLDKELLRDLFGNRKRIADIVVRCRLLPGPGEPGDTTERFFLIHIEHQSEREPDFPLRMCEYCVRIARTHRCKVYPIALFSYDQPRSAEPNTLTIDFPHKTVLQFDYDAVQLNRMDWRDYLNRPSPIVAALMLRMNVAPEDRRRVTLECLRMMATFRMDRSKMRFLSAFIGATARLTRQEHAALLQDIAALPSSERARVMPVTIGWVEYGRALGIEQGIEQGRASGVQDLLLRLGERRFGPPSLEVSAAVRAIRDVARLEDLVLCANDVESWQDLLNLGDTPASGT